MEKIILICALAISTPQGQICIKPDGNVVLPEPNRLTEQSKKFWQELGKVYRLVKDEWCL